MQEILQRGGQSSPLLIVEGGYGMNDEFWQELKEKFGEQLDKLEDDTEAVLAEMEPNEEWAVNWDCLYCTSAAIGFDNGGWWWDVDIGEASATENNFRDAVEEGLKAKGWEGPIVVSTEW